MKSILTIILTLTAVIAGESAELTPAIVVRVLDGDTIEVSADGGLRMVRLIGVDAAPLHSRWIVGQLGREAAAYTRAALMSRDVWLEYDVVSVDKYGRTLAYVWDTSPDIWPREMFNSRLVLAGHALPLRISPNITYSQFFDIFEREAKAARVGRWALGR
jgi:micrococcal nuclease